MQANQIAGPYELTHKKIAGDKMTLSILSNNTISTRKYENGKLTNSKQKACKDFEAAMAQLEQMIDIYKVDYNVKEDVNGS
jgi:hypothetical protein